MGVGERGPYVMVGTWVGSASELYELEEDDEAGALVGEGKMGVAVGHQVGRYVFITVGVAVGMRVAVGMIRGVEVARGIVGLI